MTCANALTQIPTSTTVNATTIESGNTRSSCARGMFEFRKSPAS
jgi:hypothetical protein